MTGTFNELLGARVATTQACALTGRSRATHYRRLRPPRPRRPPIPQAERKAPTQAMTPAERAAVLVALNTGPNGDLSVPWTNSERWATRGHARTSGGGGVTANLRVSVITGDR